MTVRTVKRRGIRRLIIDILYKNPEGSFVRYRRDSEIQTMSAAKEEEQRRLVAIATTGSPDGRVRTPVGPPVEAARLIRAGRPTRFAALVDEYLTTYAVSQLKPSTRRGYEKVLRSFLVPRIGSRLIGEIDAGVVRTLDAELAQRDVRMATRHNMQSVLRSVLCRYAVEAKYLPEPPSMPRLPKVGQTVLQVLTETEVDLITEKATVAQRRAFLLGADAGLRAGEIRALRVRDLDLVAGHLIVRESTCHGITSTPKSGSERIIPLTERLRAELVTLKDAPKSTFVTTDDAGAPWKENSLGKAFKRACKRAGLTGWSLHDLRHYFVTSLFRAGVGAPTVQTLAGHSHLKTTQRYAHVVAVDLRDAIAKLSRASGA